MRQCEVVLHQRAAGGGDPDLGGEEIDQLREPPAMRIAHADDHQRRQKIRQEGRAGPEQADRPWSPELSADDTSWTIRKEVWTLHH
ncbi:hypothetical protein [Streptomyces sp. NPDC102462]|uniref:hypothetical protein n=1 Tax=Streptomyces sp. NPDC102462 TaxID=3366178 RepID=UPI00382D65C8